MTKEQIEFLMGLDSSLEALKKTEKDGTKLNDLRAKLHSLTNREFYKNAYEGIHENSIESNLKFQGEEFYLKSPALIKFELVESFIEMERAKRKNNFPLMSTFILKQLECIVNYFFYSNDLLLEEFKQNRLKITFTRKTEEGETVKWGYPIQRTFLPLRNYSKPNNPFFTDSEYDSFWEQENVFTEIRNQTLYTRFKIALYFKYYKKIVLSKGEFDEKLKTFNSIYQVRNTIHGSKLSNVLEDGTNNLSTSDLIVKDCLQRKPFLAFIFSSFLAEFVEKVFY